MPMAKPEVINRSGIRRDGATSCTSPVAGSPQRRVSSSSLVRRGEAFLGLVRSGERGSAGAGTSSWSGPSGRSSERVYPSGSLCRAGGIGLTKLRPSKGRLRLPSKEVFGRVLGRARGTVVTWLILPVVICLSQRLSHACLSINKFVL